MTTDAGRLVLAHLSFLADNEAWGAFTGLLCKPLEFRNRRSAPLDTHSEVLLENIDQRLARFGELRNLFHIVLLSAYLRFPEECPPAVASFLADRDIRTKWLPEVNLGALPARQWTVAPVVLALGQRAEIRYFVVGLDASASGSVRMPPWAESLLDDTAKHAILDAAQAAVRVCNRHTNAGFRCFPLCLPNESIQIRGRSLGLPLGLAFAGLLAGEKPGRVIAATGDLAADGSVRGVGGLDLKTVCLAANPRRFKALLCPAENGAPGFCEGVEPLPVSNLEEGLTLANLYSPGKASLLIQLPAMLRDPGRFASGCRTLDPAWIRWAGARGKLAGVAEQIAASQGFFQELAAGLEGSLKDWNLDLAQAIASVVPADRFRKVSSNAPLAAFKWCLLNIAVANHTGDVAGEVEWRSLGDSLIERIQQVDSKIIIDYFNRCLVSEHNRFRFAPQTPPGLEVYLGFLEDRLKKEHDLFGTEVDLVLGGLYGTLGQHYAFCGPEHIRDALRFFGAARRVLGEGTVNDFREEWRRQLNYEAFAYLDSGRFEEARQRVCAYLEVSDLHDVRPEAMALEPPWKHNLLARFLADASEAGLCRQYLLWAERRNFAPPEPEHPWQLWSFNVGRIAFALGNTEAAARSFRNSLGLCIKAMPTIKVMSLLGLAGLARINALPEDLLEIESEVRRAAAELNPDHFADVLKAPFVQVLEQTWRNPGKLFPFSYH